MSNMYGKTACSIAQKYRRKASSDAISTEVHLGHKQILIRYNGLFFRYNGLRIRYNVFTFFITVHYSATTV